MNTSGQRYFPADRDLEAIAERDLWTAVFLQAIDDLTETKGPKSRAIQKAAHRSFESRSEDLEQIHCRSNIGRVNRLFLVCIGKQHRRRCRELL